MVTKNKVIKVSDFGTSKEVMKNKVMMTYVGTIPNMSPEVRSRNSYSIKCDVWSIGVMVYELLTGRHLYQNAFEGNVILG